MYYVNAVQLFPNPSRWLKVDGGGGGQSTNKIAGPICHSVANLVLIQCKPWTNQQFQCRLQPLKGGTPVTTISQCQKRKCTVHQPIKQGPRKQKKSIRQPPNTTYPQVTSTSSQNGSRASESGRRRIGLQVRYMAQFRVQHLDIILRSLEHNLNQQNDVQRNPSGRRRRRATRP